MAQAHDYIGIGWVAARPVPARTRPKIRI